MDPVAELESARRRIAELETALAQRSRIETELRQSEERFRTLADFTYDWEYWQSPEQTFLYVSPSCERITGYSAQAFLDDPDLYLRIVHPEDRERMRMHHDAQLSDSPHAGIDFRIIHASGEERWISHTCRPVYDRDGTFLGRRGSNRDVTEHRIMERAGPGQRLFLYSAGVPGRGEGCPAGCGGAGEGRRGAVLEGAPGRG